MFSIFENKNIESMYMKKKFDLVDYNGIVEDFTEYDFTTKELVVMKCHECCCYQSTEVKQCDAKSCPLYPLKIKWYKRPKRKKEYSEDERLQLLKRMDLMRANKK